MWKAASNEHACWWNREWMTFRCGGLPQISSPIWWSTTPPWYESLSCRSLSRTTTWVLPKSGARRRATCLCVSKAFLTNKSHFWLCRTSSWSTWSSNTWSVTRIQSSVERCSSWDCCGLWWTQRTCWPQQMWVWPVLKMFSALFKARTSSVSPEERTYLFFLALCFWEKSLLTVSLLTVS